MDLDRFPSPEPSSPLFKQFLPPKGSRAMQGCWELFFGLPLPCIEQAIADVTNQMRLILGRTKLGTPRTTVLLNFWGLGLLIAEEAGPRMRA